MDIASMNSVVPAAIERIVREQGIKKSVVAARANMSTQMFSDILNGRRLIKPNDILMISRALDVMPNDLFKPERCVD